LLRLNVTWGTNVLPEQAPALFVLMAGLLSFNPSNRRSISNRAIGFAESAQPATGVWHGASCCRGGTPVRWVCATGGRHLGERLEVGRHARSAQVWARTTGHR
jgi:hypothetical protein